MLTDERDRAAERAAIPHASRRGFLIGAAAFAGGLMIGFRPTPTSAQTSVLNPFAGHVAIAPDGTVTVYAAHMDMGQGIHHGIATLVNEELMADWAKIRVEGGSGNPAYYGNIAWGGKVQGTGGSTGMVSSFDRYRTAGAAARLMLVNAAAAEWGVPAAAIWVENGKLRHGNREAHIGEFAAKAAAGAVPTDITLKAAKDWVYIGKERHVLGKFDSRAKSTGEQQYTIDVKLPGLLTAAMIHPPLFGAKVKSFDAAKAKAMKGVVDVVQIPRGIAVVADNMWHAIQARDAVTVEWDESEAEKRSSSDLMASYRELAAKPGAATATDIGDVGRAFAGAAKVIEATYEFPYLAHAPLEPLNAIARIENGRVEVWGGHQMPDVYIAVSAKIAGVAPDKVKLQVMKTGGGFGRRAVADADVVSEAVAVSKALGGRPVRVQWTREDDTRAGRYRPAYVHRLKAGLDADGNVIAWQNHIVGQSILAGTPFDHGAAIDRTSVEGASKLPYAFPNMKVELTTTKVGVPVLWWRSVGSSHTAYAVEAFIDELAEAAGKDPIAFRLALIKDHPRHVAALRLAAEKARWGEPLAAGRFRGVALAESFGTVVAQIAEISVDNGRRKTHRVVCAVDCGIAVNPDNVRAQMEGGIGFGLGAVLKSKLTLDRGRIVEGNFDGYEVLQIDEMPAVEVYIVPSEAKPSGVGEPGVPPIGPAVANAFYQATKRRIRALPFSQGENT
ncbi:MAG: xanthine dehydrogenase family protein molybdopterin-binding subunit [Xanthobacteraceae bacterium]